jgi:hypothetical protein
VPNLRVLGEVDAGCLPAQGGLGESRRADRITLKRGQIGHAQGGELAVDPAALECFRLRLEAAGVAGEHFRHV